MKRELTSEYMEEVSKGFSVVFNDALKEAHKDYLKIAMEVKANTIVVDYRWLADLPTMREWINDRVLNKLSAWDYQIKKKDWESTISVHRDVVEYDDLGVVKPKIQDLANSVSDHYNAQVFGLLETNGNCYDGAPFFGEHEVGIGSATTTLTNVGANDLTKDGFFKTLKQMRRIVADNGVAIRIKPNLVVVPPELEAKAIELFGCEKLGGSSNPLYGRCVVLVSPDLTDAKSWYLLDTTRAVKPIILQINKGAEFNALDNPNHNERAFMSNEFLYGINTQDNVGYGLWSLAFKNTIA